ncbi:MAG: hypothetical protein CBARDCOR_3852, partial [uncultured Caballeronia sp.]
MGLALMTGPGELVAALIASRALVGGLYACVAFCLQWACYRRCKSETSETSETLLKNGGVGSR